MGERIEAVLFMVFNRPDLTRAVFERIRQARPKRLYFAADGPRERDGEKEICEEVRGIINGVDWDCEIHTLLRETNLGCKTAISSAISWFFDHEEMGIILEDDCLPDPTFFTYCHILLERYRDNPQIMMIAGSDPILGKLRIRESYFFSRYYHIWGWASWRRAWASYDIDMKQWPRIRSSGILKARYGDELGAELETLFQSTFSGHTNTWDSQWFISCMINEGLCIIPRVNLISNIGVQGVHTNGFNNRLQMTATRPIHPSNRTPKVEPDLDSDRLLFDAVLCKTNYILAGIHYRSRLLLIKVNPSIGEKVRLRWLLELAMRI
ncbi:MAG: hypothetical protein WCK39_01855 [Methanomassiliicoccales archaeon]